MSDGITLIAEERKRQIQQEGWTAAHDDGHDNGVLGIAAAALAVDGTDARVEGAADPWGLVSKHRGNRVRQLVIAGALISAEIDRLQRHARTGGSIAPKQLRLILVEKFRELLSLENVGFRGFTCDCQLDIDGLSAALALCVVETIDQTNTES